jgi:hypothetical protein
MPGHREDQGHEQRAEHGAELVERFVDPERPPVPDVLGGVREDAAREIASAAADLSAKPVLAVFMTDGPPPASLAEAGIPTFTYPEQAAAPLVQIARWAEWRARPAGHVVTPPGIDPGRGRAAANKVLAGQPGGGWADAGAVNLLIGGEQVKQQRAQACLVQHGSRVAVPGGCAGCCRCHARTPRSRLPGPARPAVRRGGPPRR